MRGYQKDAVRLQATPGQHRIQAIQPQNPQEVPRADVLSSSESFTSSQGYRKGLISDSKP